MAIRARALRGDITGKGLTTVEANPFGSANDATKRHDKYGGREDEGEIGV
jgi:hypothetical protein